MSSNSHHQTQKLIELASQKNSPTYQPAPFILDYGEGCRLYDLEKNEYLDFLAGIAVNCLGYGETAVVRAIQEQSKKLMHISNMFVSQPQIELLDKLTQLTFADRVYFCNSGAEANEAALKLARRYQTVFKGDHERTDFIAMKKSFHGRTMGALSATGQPKYHKGFEPLIPGFSYADFNDLDSVEKLISNKTAAVILEPIQGEGGLLPATKEFLHGVRQLCDQHGALLIFDEVQSGFGRTGKWYAYMHDDVTPDIMSTAKGLGSGFPIGAMLASYEVFQGFVPGSHATTYGGNPLGTAASLAAIKEIEDKNLLQNVTERGQQLQDGLKEIAKSYSVIKDVRGRGLMVGAELQGDYAATTQARLRDEHRILINCCGGNTLRFVPPYIITENDVDQVLQAVQSVVKTL